MLPPLLSNMYNTILFDPVMGPPESVVNFPCTFTVLGTLSLGNTSADGALSSAKPTTEQNNKPKITKKHLDTNGIFFIILSPYYIIYYFKDFAQFTQNLNFFPAGAVFT